MNGDLILGRFDKATVIAFACSILLILAGALAKPDFLSVDYIVQQLQTASFLGIIATAPSVIGLIIPSLSSIALGGTGLLIVVSVVVETMKQIEAQLLMRNYEGFIR